MNVHICHCKFINQIRPVWCLICPESWLSWWQAKWLLLTGQLGYDSKIEVSSHWQVPNLFRTAICNSLEICFISGKFVSRHILLINSNNVWFDIQSWIYCQCEYSCEQLVPFWSHRTRSSGLHLLSKSCYQIVNYKVNSQVPGGGCDIWHIDRSTEYMDSFWISPKIDALLIFINVKVKTVGVSGKWEQRWLKRKKAYHMLALPSSLVVFFAGSR